MTEGRQRNAIGVAQCHQQVEPEHQQRTESQLEEKEFEAESTVSPSVLATRTDHDSTAVRPASLPSPVSFPPLPPDPAARSSPVHTSRGKLKYAYLSIGRDLSIAAQASYTSSHCYNTIARSGQKRRTLLEYRSLSTTAEYDIDGPTTRSCSLQTLQKQQCFLSIC